MLYTKVFLHGKEARDLFTKLSKHQKTGHIKELLGSFVMVVDRYNLVFGVVEAFKSCASWSADTCGTKSVHCGGLIKIKGYPLGICCFYPSFGKTFITKVSKNILSYVAY